MSEATSTPGPWVICDEFADRPGIDAETLSVVVYGSVEDDPEIGIQGETFGQRMANARLIAAAPDLLEALKLAELWMLGGTPTQYSDQVVLEEIQSALAKAKGDNQ